MPVATDAQIAHAVREQRAMLGMHKARLLEKYQRYSGTPENLSRALVYVEYIACQEKLELLIALENGLTVAPS